MVGGGGGVSVRGQLVEREKHINNVCSVQEKGRVACVGQGRKGGTGGWVR